MFNMFMFKIPLSGIISIIQRLTGTVSDGMPFIFHT